MPTVQNLTGDSALIRGDSNIFTVTVTDQDGAAMNLTGAKLFFTAKYSRSDTDAEAIFQKSSPSNGIEITSAAGGLATVTITTMDTYNLTENIAAYYDLQVKDSSGRVFTATRGRLEILMDATVNYS